MHERWRHFGGEVIRLRWMWLGAMGALLARYSGMIPDTSPFALVVHKPALVALGMIIGHIARSQILFYVDLRALLLRVQASQSVPDALVFLAACLLAGSIYLAAILGVTLGL